MTRAEEQREAALAEAQRVRCWRAETKRALRAGQVSAAELLREPPYELLSMKTYDLLMAIPKVGRSKANKMIGALRVAHSRTVGALTQRQREELIRVLPQGD